VVDQPEPVAQHSELRWTDLGAGPHLAHQVGAVEAQVPTFLAELTAAARAHLTATDPASTAVLLHGEDEVVAVLRGVQLAWDGSRAGAPGGGARESLHRAGEVAADTLAVLDVVVAERWRGRGIGTTALAGLEGWRAQRGAERLLVLLRPHAKADYPLVPFARYISFVNDDGEPFDPWLRTAWRAGLVPVRGIDRSLVARAALADWQRWIGRPVPGSGPYLIPGAIKPAILETERDAGGYREPHLWVAPATSIDDVRASPAGAPGVGGSSGSASGVGGSSGSASGVGGSPGSASGVGGSPGQRRRPDWVASLAAAGVVAGDRSHREIRRRR